MQSPPRKLQQALRGFIALLVVAAAAAIIVSIAFTISYSRAPEHGDYLSAAAITFVFAFAFTAAHTFLLGLPLLLIGAWLHLLRWWSCIVAGFLIGFLPSALVSGSSFLESWPMGVLGAIGGLIFWPLWNFWVQRTPVRVAAGPTEPPVGNAD